MSGDSLKTATESNFEQKPPSQFTNQLLSPVDLFSFSKPKENYTTKIVQKWKEYCKRYPLTAQVLDRLPEQPSLGHHRPSITHEEGQDTLQMILHVTAAVSSWEKPQTQELMLLFQHPICDADLDISNILGERFAAKKGLKDFLSHETHSLPPMKSNSLFTAPLSLADFRPLRAPFVPDLIRVLVNTIEGYCHKLDCWHKLYEPLNGEQSEAKEWVLKLLQLGNNDREIRHVLQTLPGPVVICILRIFLGEFATKPLHFSTVLMQKLVQRPLFDHFLRPNPKLRSYVQRAALPVSRTELDTLAFLMIHMLHALEYNPDPIDGKLRLCNLYGPLLISFAERPRLCRTTQTSAQSEEAALLDVVLEVCDLSFWNHMSMLKIRSAFEFQTQSEKKNFARRNMPLRTNSLLDKGNKSVLTGAEKRNEVIDPGPMNLQAKIDKTDVHTCKGKVSHQDLSPTMGVDDKSQPEKKNWVIPQCKSSAYKLQNRLHLIGNFITHPLNTYPVTRKSTTRTRLKNGKYVSIFLLPALTTSRKTEFAYTPYTTSTLLEEIRLYRLGRLAIPRHLPVLAPRCSLHADLKSDQ